MRTRTASLAVAVSMVFMLATPAMAHPHKAEPAHQGAGQVIANGQNHGGYSSTWVTCGGDPAAYGLETAHHGPDSGVSGRADGCYKADSSPATDDQNPAIG